MARIRTIKPEFWHDEKLARMDDVTRLLFLALISMADDCGRLLDNIKQIEAFVWPFSDADEFASHSRIIREALANLSRSGRILRGETSSGQKIIQIANWTRHQKVDRPNVKAALPEIVAPQRVTASSNDSTNDSSNGSSSDSRTDLRPTTYDLGPTTDDLGDAGASPDTGGVAGPKRRRPARSQPEGASAPDPAPTWVQAVHDALLEYPKVHQPHGKIGGVLAAVVRATNATPDQLREAVRDYDAHLYSHGKRPFVLTNFAAELPKLLAMQGQPLGDGFGGHTERSLYVVGAV